jgi:ATP-binding cassette, subfamily B, bacterial MsbA
MQGTQLYQRLLRYLRPYRRHFAWTLLSMVLLAATEPAIPGLMKPMLDGSFVHKDPFLIRLIPLALVLLALVRGAAMFGSDFGLQWVATRVVMDLREGMFRRLLVLPTAFYDANSSGRLISKLIYDVNNVSSAATQTLLVLVRDSLAVVGLLGLMVYLDWTLSLIALLIIPSVGLIIRHIGQRLRHLSRAQQDAMGHMTHVLEEAVKGHKIVKVFDGFDYEAERYRQAADGVRRYYMKFTLTGNINSVSVHLISSLALAAIVYYASVMSAAGKLTVGDFVAFFGAMALLINPIKRLTKINEQLQLGLAAAQSVFELMDQPAEVDTGHRDPGRVRGEIELRGVSLRYPGAEREALRDIDLHIRPNETVALVGASGSGKSSLANLLPHLYPPSAGRILLDGVDIRDLGLAGLRRQIALVSQEVVLFNDTVAANIAYGGMRGATEAALQEAARAAHAAELVAQLSQGLATEIGENGVRLSGGQRQRLAIARAILKDAPVLIFDEATSALDAESERYVQDAIERLQGNRTLILIAHRLSTVRHADRILVLEAGRIVESGTHDELLARDGAYARLYRQAQKETPSDRPAPPAASPPLDHDASVLPAALTGP